MWVCPACGESHDDRFKICWKCAGAETPGEEPALLPEAPPPERKLRSLASVLVRALAGFLIGTIFGVAVFHRYGATLPQALASGALVGVVWGAIVGVFVWVVFPYSGEGGSPSHP